MITRMMSPFETQVDRLLSDAMRSLGSHTNDYAPASNVWEDAEQFGIDMSLPGWKSEDVRIEAENGYVTVEGKRKDEKNEEAKNGKSYFVRELRVNSFSRTFRLPNNLEWSEAKASFNDGVLTIAFPKRADAKSRRIAIQ
jgi:HSP20 family protein